MHSAAQASDDDAEAANSDNEDWEPLLERGAASSHTTKYVSQGAGAWKTPAADREQLAPHSRIQRREPAHCFQAHYNFGDRSISKTFPWNKDPYVLPTQARDESCKSLHEPHSSWCCLP